MISSKVSVNHSMEIMGRPGLPPGMYFRRLLIGYFIAPSLAQGDSTFEQ